MRKFTDSEGRVWQVGVNVTSITNVRTCANVDLLALGDAEQQLIEKLFSDPIILCQILYVLCHDQAAENGVSEEDFGRAMWGDVLDAALDALLGELVDFCRNPIQRANLQRAMTAMRGAVNRAHELIQAKLDAGELDREIEAALKDSGVLSTSAPESSESTPAP